MVDGQATTSDEEGIGRVGRLDKKRVKVEVALAGWGPTSTTARRPSDRPVLELVVELDEVGSLEGTLSDDVGDSVAGATLRAHDANDAELATTTSGADGSFVFPALPEGEVTVVALPPPNNPHGWMPVEVQSDVRRREVTRDVHLRFERP